MGLTVIQKSPPRKKRKGTPRIGLVLAGGAISGGAFKLGGLIALNTYLEGRKVTDFDVYVGVSAGAFLAAPLSAGIPPEELMRSIEGRSSIITQFRPWHFYNPNWEEYLSRPVALARGAATFLPALMSGISKAMRTSDGKDRARALMSEPSYPNVERFMAPVIRYVTGHSAIGRSAFSFLPSGVFDNSPIERFIRDNLRRNRLPNNFRLLHLERKNSLYISSTHLNTARRVLFGHDEDTSATISEAVQASSAIPGFFRPVKIGTEEYIDGGVRRTANLRACADKGADLIICYNPFRPYANVFDGRPGHYRSMAQMGPAVILDQVFRTLLHSRLQQGIQRLALDPTFRGDLIVIEPTESDARMFNISPVAFWKRAEAAEAGYLSVKRTLERHHARLAKLFDGYELRTNLQRLKDDESALRVARRVDEEVFDILGREEVPETQSQRLYVVK